jgi:hypothetical protein
MVLLVNQIHEWRAACNDFEMMIPLSAIDAHTS